MTPVTRHELLSEVHRAYAPRSYFEIGVDLGRSLSLSRAPTIAVDPAYELSWEVHCDLQLVRATSDDFFARDDGLAHLPAGVVDLAFIDGLHLFEHVLRDFANVERHSHWASVILLDDVLPRNAGEASRERSNRDAWTGDVYKITDALQRNRPDLLVLPLDIHPTGVLLVLGADPESTTLDERFDELVAEYVRPDPQEVPEAVLRRELAFDPVSITSELWSALRDARDSGQPRELGWELMRRAFAEAVRKAGPRSPVQHAAEPAQAPRTENGRHGRGSRARSGSETRSFSVRVSKGLRRALQRRREEPKFTGLVPQRPPGTAQASMFFDRHPRFYASSKTTPFRGRLNLRYEAIFADNRDIFAGARVIDIASHDGRWSFAALKTGAAEVVGIEARAELVDTARENLAHYVADASRYRFIAGDVFDVLAREEDPVDVVLCLGYLYHTFRYPELMRRIRDRQPRYLIIDTVVVPGKTKPIVHLRTERAQRERDAVVDPFAHGDRTLVGRPSVAGLEALLEAYGFAVERFSDWGSLLRDNPALSNVSDYAQGRRVTARCVSVS
jgi:Methyltransferase domain